MDELPSSPGLIRRLAYSRMIRIRNTRRNFERRNAYANINDFQAVSNFDIPSDNYNYNGRLDIKSLVENSKVLYFNETKNEKVFCSICQDEGYGIYRKLYCDHLFHIDCIDRWLINNCICPMCRKCLKLKN